MWREHIEKHLVVAKHILVFAALGGFGVDVELVRQAGLVVGVDGLQADHVVGGLDHRRVVVTGFVDDGQLHQAPKLRPASSVWEK